MTLRVDMLTNSQIHWITSRGAMVERTRVYLLTQAQSSLDLSDSLGAPEGQLVRS